MDEDNPGTVSTNPEMLLRLYSGGSSGTVTGDIADLITIAAGARYRYEQPGSDLREHPACEDILI